MDKFEEKNKKEMLTTPLTAEEIENDAKQRLSLIDKEFREGLAFIRKYEKSVSFFGSAVLTEKSSHYKQARNLAGKVAEAGYAVVTGGGGGIMEAANRGAYEAGGQSIGLNITLPKEQTPNGFLTDFYQFYYFFSRKVALSFAAEAYLFFPGGYGTLDEFFEIITLVQTYKITPVPIILIGSDFWNPLDQFIKETLLKKHGSIDERSLHLYRISDDEKEILDIIQKTPVLKSVPFSKNKKT